MPPFKDIYLEMSSINFRSYSPVSANRSRAGKLLLHAGEQVAHM